MTDLSTTFSGLTLKNPIIAGSCGLTEKVSDVQELEKNGAAAVVLKSIFEEDIAFEFEDMIKKENVEHYNLEQFDYFDYRIKDQHIKKYLNQIEACKEQTSIPIIASVNCTYSHEWTFFAKKIESAGADALELNMFFLPSDFNRTSEQQEQAYFKIIENVTQAVSIPVALKISFYFSNLGPFIQKLSNTGIAGLVLFNRFYSIDFDIDDFKITSTNILSTPAELALSLRWIAIMAERVNCDLAASTGIHDGQAVIKQLLAGAKAVQIVSTLYKNGPSHIQKIIHEIEYWMKVKGYASVDEFRGKMSQSKSSNPAAYERVQFMKYFSGRE